MARMHLRTRANAHAPRRAAFTHAQRSHNHSNIALDHFSVALDGPDGSCVTVV